MKIELSTLQSLDDLIKRKATGTPQELANKLGLSKRMIYHYLETLRTDYGLALEYNEYCQSYIYTDDKVYKIELGRKE